LLAALAAVTAAEAVLAKLEEWDMSPTMADLAAMEYKTILQDQLFIMLAAAAEARMALQIMQAAKAAAVMVDKVGVQVLLEQMDSAAAAVEAEARAYMVVMAEMEL
tara:strand:+ start:202 stop:519 length:318 start_codon:yes stop_codon:yes gene_type:complete